MKSHNILCRKSIFKQSYIITEFGKIKYCRNSWLNLSLWYVGRQEVSARIQQEKQLAALEAQQAEMQRKRDSPQHRDIHRSSSPGQQKSTDQVKSTLQEESEDMVFMLDFVFTLLIFKKRGKFLWHVLFH